MTPEAFAQDRLGELIAKYLDRALDDGEWEELDRTLAADAGAARRFASATRFEQQLRQLTRAQGNADSVKHLSMSERIAAYVSPSERDIPALAPPSRPSPALQPKRSNERPRRVAAGWWTAAAAAAALLIATLSVPMLVKGTKPGAGSNVAQGPASPHAPIATVVFLGARVHGAPLPRLIRPNGASEPLSMGQQLLPGDHIDSGGLRDSAPETCVGLSLNLGATLDLAPGTQCDLREQTRISVSAGRLFASVDKSASHVAGTAARLTIETPSADVRITGTRFDLTAESERTLVRMEDGTVEVGNAAGSRPVSTLQECVIAKGSAPLAPTSIAKSELWLGQRSDAAGTGVLWDCGFGGGGGTWIVTSGTMASAPDGGKALASVAAAGHDAGAATDTSLSVAAKSSQPWLFIAPADFVLRVRARSEHAGGMVVQMEANGQAWRANVADVGTENGWVRLDLRAADFISSSGAAIPGGASVSAIRIDGLGLGTVWVDSLRLASGAASTTH